MDERMPQFGADGKWIGASVPRLEDPRLLSGRGRFVDDIAIPGCLHARFVRASVAHAIIQSIDLSSVRAVPGVVAAWDATDLPMAGVIAELDRPMEEFTPTEMPILAVEKVRYMGEPVALVVAVDPYVSEDAAELAHVEYEMLPAVTSTGDALDSGAALVHEEASGNIFVDVRLFDTDGVDRAFTLADEIVEISCSSGRQNALPLETRAAIAQWDDREDQLVLYTPTQVPHLVRSVAAASCGVSERQVRVVVPDMGGGFGLKCVVGREEIAVAAAALDLKRPVRWVEDRSEALTASFLGREQEYRAKAAFSAEGRMEALDVDVVCDMGSYSCYPFSAAIEPLMASAEMPGVYRLAQYRVRGRAVATNKAPTAPYRGVSRPQYVMLMEMIMDAAARRLELDPVEIRRRNLITEFPYTNVNKVTYDPGSYLESLELADACIREEGWYDFRERARRDGRVVGIGFGCFSERTGYGSAAFAQRRMKVVPGFDLSEVSMDLDGYVTVTTGTMSHGQGHETTMAQIVAERLQVDINRVKVHQGDTDRINYGFGTFASRSAVIGGSAVKLAGDDLGERLREIGAHLLEIPFDETELYDGTVRSRQNPGMAVPYQEIARIAYHEAHLLPKVDAPGLKGRAAFDVDDDGTFSNATHAAVVELDPCTGNVRIHRYVCVEDCGVALNPKIVDGQARGGIAQGIAGALFEEITYSPEGAPTGSSFIDYLVPTAMEIPDVRIEHLETPCLSNETGAKGAGEGGTIGAPATILNAVNDALEPAGGFLHRTPITPWDIHAQLAVGGAAFHGS